MGISRRAFLKMASGVTAAQAIPRFALAQAWPARPITMIVPFPAGGPADAIARVLADQMKTYLGQPVIVENVSGAGGTIGVARVARSAPDGYTLGIGQLNSHVFSSATYIVRYDLLKDFEPVALLTSNPQMIVGKRDLPARNMKELVSLLKSNPGRETFATPGVGSPSHVWGIHFQNSVGARLQFVPYRGGTPALQDVLSGQIDLTCLQASDLLPHVRSGSVKAYAILANAPWSRAPDIPTVDEAGIPGLYMPFWHGLWAPAKTPKPVIAKVNSAIGEALADASIRQRFADMGQEIFPSEQRTPEALAALQKSEIEKWWPVIRSANITLE